MKFETLPLTLRQLQYAVAVADEKSFRRAAEVCHVAQPSLSAQIAELEHALGLQLFERDRRRVLLTQAGEALIARARTVLIEADALVEAAARHKDPLAGTLRIGVIPTLGPYLLPEVDPALRTAFPRLSLQWIEDKTEVLVARVERGELDAALLALEADLGHLEYETIGRDAFVLAAGKQHALARSSAPLPLERLNGEQVLLLDEGHCLRDQALALCARAGVEERGFRATSLPTLTQMVAAGPSITLLPEIAVELENRRGLLAVRPFSAPAPYRTVVLAYRARSGMREALHAIAESARAAFEQSRARNTREARGRGTPRASTPGAPIARSRAGRSGSRARPA